jgi:hypothetical protein
MASNTTEPARDEQIRCFADSLVAGLRRQAERHRLEEHDMTETTDNEEEKIWSAVKTLRDFHERKRQALAAPFVRAVSRRIGWPERAEPNSHTGHRCACCGNVSAYAVEVECYRVAGELLPVDEYTPALVAAGGTETTDNEKNQAFIDAFHRGTDRALDAAAVRINERRREKASE